MIWVQCLQYIFKSVHYFSGGPRRPIPSAHNKWFCFRFRYLDTDQFHVIIREVGETLIIYRVPNIEGHTTAISIFPFKGIFRDTDLTIYNRAVSLIASISTVLDSIQILSWSICLYKLTKLIEAILNHLVSGIAKFGWTCALLENLLGESVGVFGWTWLLWFSSMWGFVAD